MVLHVPHHVPRRGRASAAVAGRRRTPEIVRSLLSGSGTDAVRRRRVVSLDDEIARLGEVALLEMVLRQVFSRKWTPTSGLALERIVARGCFEVVRGRDGRDGAVAAPVRCRLRPVVAALELHRQRRHPVVDERLELDASRLVGLVRRAGVVGRPAALVHFRGVGHQPIEAGADLVLPLLLAVVHIWKKKGHIVDT